MGLWHGHLGHGITPAGRPCLEFVHFSRGVDLGEGAIREGKIGNL
jgi:hypothetical protein